MMNNFKSYYNIVNNIFAGMKADCASEIRASKKICNLFASVLAKTL